MATDDDKQAAFTHLAQGKRHLMVKDYAEATASLSVACELLAKIYGDNAKECGDAYFNYGKALLELARSENGVLGNTVEEEVQSDDDEEEEEQENEEESEVKADQNGNGESSATSPDTTGTVAMETGTVESAKNGGDVKEETGSLKVGDGDTIPNGQDGDQKPEGENEEDEEDVTNLHLAWEILEVAKSIFEKEAESDKTVKLKLAEVHLLLGEVGLESENFTQGTDDMNTCLQIQIENLPPDSRRIAETYYQLGMGYGMANLFDDAIEAYAKCGKLLELRVTNLNNMIKEGLKPEGDDPFYSFEGEIKELEQLFPEIKDKISDMQDFKNETRKAMLNAAFKKEGSDPGAGSSKDIADAGSSSFGGGSTSAFGGSSSSLVSSTSSSTEAKPISNISHLVRKKPRTNSDSEKSGSDNAKRICMEDDQKS